MKHLVFIFLLIFSTSYSKEYEIVSEYDKFDNRTTYNMRDIPTGVELSNDQFKLVFDLFTSFRGTERNTFSVSDFVYIGITSLSKDWEYLRGGQTVVFLLDNGARIEYDGDYSSDVFSGGTCYEHFSFKIPLSDLKKIIDANKVDVKIGYRTGILPKNTMNAFEKFYTAAYTRH